MPGVAGKGEKRKSHPHCFSTENHVHAYFPFSFNFDDSFGAVAERLGGIGAGCASDGDTDSRNKLAVYGGEGGF